MVAKPLPEPVERVARFLAEARAEACLQEFRGGTSTAEDAAEAIGCQADQIVKSLVFLCDGKPVLALIPGSRRADPAKVAREAGAASARIASARKVFEATGFRVGGVAPFPLPGIREVLADRGLLRHELVWAGAGSERHLVCLAPTELLRLARARTVDLTLDG